jgi:ribonucleoside-diphosphate reductase alpha chain
VTDAVATQTVSEDDNIERLREREEEPVVMAQAPQTGKANVSSLRAEARSKGYTGEQCSACGSMRVKRNGACTLCDDCGTTSGCS